MDREPITDPQASEHWLEVEQLDGEMPPLFNAIGLYVKELRKWNGFVVDGFVDDEIKGRIKAEGYPLRRERKLFGNRDAKKKLREATEKLGTDQILFLAVPCQRNYENWSIGPVIISDLFVDDPEELKREAIKALEGDNYLLQFAKEQAYLAVTGHADLE